MANRSPCSEGNFALDGLVEFDMHGKTVGVIGTASATGHLLGFALQKLRGSLRRIPATDAVFSKDFGNAHETCRRHNCRICGFERGRSR
jgi:hypothetical protein